MNVVGLYYGETFEVKEDPSVLDVLKAASGEKTPSGVLSFAPNQSNPNLIDWVEVDLAGIKTPTSRKARLKKKPRKLKNRVLRLQEGVYNQEASSGGSSLISIAWQYYVEKARTKNPPLVTTTFSIDNVIVDAGESNDVTEGKKIEAVSYTHLTLPTILLV